jgi:hypothetical protein
LSLVVFWGSTTYESIRNVIIFEDESEAVEDQTEQTFWFIDFVVVDPPNKRSADLPLFSQFAATSFKDVCDQTRNHRRVHSEANCEKGWFDICHCNNSIQFNSVRVGCRFYRSCKGARDLVEITQPAWPLSRTTFGYEGVRE